jgi:hypothetical protein
MAGFGKAPVSNAALALWDKLRARIVASVSDYNCEAGETVWTVRDGGSDRCELAVVGSSADAPRLSLSLDARDALLVCSFDSPTPSNRWEFSVMPDGNTVLRSSQPRRFDDAARDILDYLVRRGMPAA